MKRYLRVLMPVLTFLVLAFILSNSLSDQSQAEEKRNLAIKLVTEKTFKRSVLACIAKIFHMLEYSAFSFCLTSSVLLLGDGLKNRFERILLCGMTLAMADELIQSLFSGRGSKLTDVLVDTAGIMIGYALTIGIGLLLKKIKKKKKEET